VKAYRKPNQLTLGHPQSGRVVFDSSNAHQWRMLDNQQIKILSHLTCKMQRWTYMGIVERSVRQRGVRGYPEALQIFFSELALHESCRTVRRGQSAEADERL